MAKILSRLQSRHNAQTAASGIRQGHCGLRNARLKRLGNNNRLEGRGRCEKGKGEGVGEQCRQVKELNWGHACKTAKLCLSNESFFHSVAEFCSFASLTPIITCPFANSLTLFDEIFKLNKLFYKLQKQVPCFL